MLELRPHCELCNCDLPAESTGAMICSFECTFCHDCTTQKLQGICPNCGGPLEKRPMRPVKLLHEYPAAARRAGNAGN